MLMPLAYYEEQVKARRLPVARAAALAALLGVELVALMLRFNTESLEQAGQAWWADTLWTWKIMLPPLAIALSTAGVLLGGDRLRAELERFADDVATAHRVWPFLLAHLAAFAVFARLTAYLLEGGFATSPSQDLWVASWLAAAGVAMALWVASLFPPLVLAGILWRARALVVGILAVGLLAWGAGTVTENWWDPLRHATMTLVAKMVALVFADPVFVPDRQLVGTERFYVQVLRVCAGYESIGLIWVFLSAYLVMFRDRLRFPHALLLVPIGTVVVWAANLVRLTALIAIGTLISPDVALGGFHSYSGSLLFSAVAIGIVYAARRAPFFSLDAGLVRPAGDVNITAAYLLPFLAIVATQMVAGALSAGGVFDYAYPARVVAAGAALVYFRGAYRPLRRTCSWPAVAAGVVVFALWMALEPAHDPAKESAFAAALAGLGPAVGALWLAVRVAGAVVTVPIAEELAFRGYLARRLATADFEAASFRTFTWFAFVGSSVAFGAMHGRWLAGTLTGMVYALTLYRRGELGDAVAAHATTNALIAAYVLATGAWSLWL